jgi:hypothetical protein
MIAYRLSPRACAAVSKSKPHNRQECCLGLPWGQFPQIFERRSLPIVHSLRLPLVPFIADRIILWLWFNKAKALADGATNQDRQNNEDEEQRRE